MSAPSDPCPFRRRHPNNCDGSKASGRPTPAGGVAKCGHSGEPARIHSRKPTTDPHTDRESGRWTMNALFAGLAIFIAWPVLLIVWRRWLARQPARLLPAGGHLLVHSPPEKIAAWMFLGAVVSLGPWGIYVAWQASGATGALYLTSVSGLLGWVSALYLRSVYNRIELTARGIRQSRFSIDVLIPWSDVSRITEAPFPTAVLIHGRDGTKVRLDKLMVGLPIVFTYFREHLSGELNSSAINYLLPETALRMRVAAGRQKAVGSDATEDL